MWGSPLQRRVPAEVGSPGPGGRPSHPNRPEKFSVRTIAMGSDDNDEEEDDNDKVDDDDTAPT